MWQRNSQEKPQGIYLHWQDCQGLSYQPQQRRSGQLQGRDQASQNERGRQTRPSPLQLLQEECLTDRRNLN